MQTAQNLRCRILCQQVADNIDRQGMHALRLGQVPGGVFVYRQKLYDVANLRLGREICVSRQSDERCDLRGMPCQ